MNKISQDFQISLFFWKREKPKYFFKFQNSDLYSTYRQFPDENIVSSDGEYGPGVPH